MLKTLKGKDLLYKKYYTCALSGYGLIGLTYLSRAPLAGLNGVLDFILGLMPNLAGSFATPFLLLTVVFDKLNNERLKRHRRLFLGLNLFTFAVALLIEFAHAWFGLGDFHRPDILASAAGFVLAQAVYRTIQPPPRPEVVLAG